MQFMFRGGDEYVKVDIDRPTKTVYMATRKSNYEMTKIPWKKLFDKGKERYQEMITDRLNDEQFRLVIIQSFHNAGYSLVGG